MHVSYNNHRIYTGPVSGWKPRKERILAENGATEAGLEFTYSAEETKHLVRAQIEASAGDAMSLLGTASDGAQLLLYHLASLVKGLSTANSLSEVRDTTDAFMPLADAFLGKVEAGEVKLPFQLKGEAAVMTEIETRATAVSDALIQAQKGG